MPRRRINCRIACGEWRVEPPLQSIIDACARGRINARVVAVIGNNSGSGALRRAAAAGIEIFHLSSVTHSTAVSLDLAICGAPQRAHADVIFWLAT